jgi:hypothetical protein
LQNLIAFSGLFDFFANFLGIFADSGHGMASTRQQAKRYDQKQGSGGTSIFIHCIVLWFRKNMQEAVCYLLHNQLATNVFSFNGI